jgi:hypothetical protein
MADNINLINKINRPICDAYIIEKQTSYFYNNPIQSKTRYLDLIYINLYKPFNAAIEGEKYFITFLNNYIKYLKVLLLKLKD